MSESYWKADYYSTFLPIVYCSGCQEMRAVEEMVDDSRCVHCN